MRSVEELTPWIAERGGVVHSAVAEAAGFTVHGIRTAIRDGELERVRRFWLVGAGCDEQLRRAAEVGGRLTCLSQAQRLGLWTPDHTELHLALAPTASRVDAAGLRLHWSPGPSPVAAKDPTDPIINVLYHVARCVPRADALAVWESAIRSRMAAPAVLAGITWKCRAASQLAAMASELSDSGIESHFTVLMSSVGIIVRQQVWLDGHPADALIGKHLVVQLDGFAFHQAKDRRRDLRADARLVLRGYTVLRFDYQQVLFQSDYVIAIVSAAIAQGRHR